MERPLVLGQLENAGNPWKGWKTSSLLSSRFLALLELGLQSQLWCHLAAGPGPRCHSSWGSVTASVKGVFHVHKYVENAKRLSEATGWGKISQIATEQPMWFPADLKVRPGLLLGGGAAGGSRLPVLTSGLARAHWKTRICLCPWSTVDLHRVCKI